MRTPSSPPPSTPSIPPPGSPAGPRRARWLRRAVAAALLGALAVAQAAPDDDYRAGLKSYNTGDVVGAMKGLQPAADAGHAKAQALLAYILERSGSVEDAERYYRLAADQGEVDAELGLAQLLMGRGGQEAEALALFQRAAGRGNAQAIDAIAEAYLRQSLGLTAARRDNRQAVAAITRSAEQGNLVAIDALATAYRSGQYDLAVDAAEAARWQARAEQLRKQRAAGPPAAPGKK